MIARYLDRLAEALDFDRALARRVLQEVEDHLRERLAADPADDRHEAERRAVAECGDPEAIATEFAVIALARRTRRVGFGVPLVLAGVYLAMKVRIAWYAATAWTLSDALRPVAAVFGLIDAWAFVLALVVGIGVSAYGGRARLLTEHRPDYCGRLRRFCAISALATTALALSVISDGALTAIHLAATSLSAAFLVPLLSMAVEIAGTAALIALIRDLARRTAATAAIERS